MENNLKHYQDNKEVFDMWIRCQERLQAGMDILQPLIEPFTKAHPQTNVLGCPDCLIDMLIWTLSEYKKVNPDKETKPKK